MEKRLRINKMYGEWYYIKEVDGWDANCWNYRLWGIDNNGKEWFFSSVISYQSMIELAKSSEEVKQRMLNY